MDLGKKDSKIYLNNIIARGDYITARSLCYDYLKDFPAPAGLSKSGANQTTQAYIKNFIYFLDNLDNIKSLYNKGKINLETISIEIYQTKNKKLPFINYSNSPVSNCPGAAACLVFCYSLNSIRFPAAFTRWAICSILEAEAPEILTEALAYVCNKRNNKKLIESQGFIDFRLYNDGDFKDLNRLYFWMDFLKQHPYIKAYAYSKSWPLFIQAVKERGESYFPDNFTLNLSSGSRYHNLKDIMKVYNFTRGEFIAVKIDRKTTGDKLTKFEKQYIRTKARSMGHKKIFICPGLCGSCSRVGHACGNKDIFKDYTIITPEH
tara:strand:+ start:966 stop:1925 length:960 start_codon:yes stop_codon:yes gene_type:complete